MADPKNKSFRLNVKTDRGVGLPINVDYFELHKVGLRRYDWRDPYHIALNLSWPAFLGAMLGMELLINALFACLYLLQPGAIANAGPGSFSDAFFFSLETLATVGYGAMSPATFYGHVIASSEIICGVAFTAVLTGLVFGRFSRPKAKIFYADKAIIGVHDGAPALMIRIANGRAALLADVRVQVTALGMGTSKEGERFRRPHDLLLRMSHFPLFPLTWTLIHYIDEKSPLAGCTPESLVKDDVRLFLSLVARDVSLSTQVNDIHGYGPTAIAFGMRYQDAVSWDEEGHTVADLTKLSLMEPLPPRVKAAP
jgi:inward rectifier potassium channel